MPFFIEVKMKEFEITEKGVYVDGVALAIGSRIRAETMPATLHNKAVEVEAEKELVLEVATPRRGRPPKEQAAE
ncbi:hypothetical protein D9M72_651390 [compost metagenome]